MYPILASVARVLGYMAVQPCFRSMISFSRVPFGDSMMLGLLVWVLIAKGILRFGRVLMSLSPHFKGHTEHALKGKKKIRARARPLLYRAQPKPFGKGIARHSLSSGPKP